MFQGLLVKCLKVNKSVVSSFTSQVFQVLLVKCFKVYCSSVSSITIQVFQGLLVKCFKVLLAKYFKFYYSVGRVSAPGNGRSRVRSRAATYQSCKNGTSCSSLGTQTYGVE